MRSDRRLGRAGALLLLLVGLCLGAHNALADRAFQTLDDLIQAHYLAYYGRSADPVGLAYWRGRLEEPGADAAEVVRALGVSAEFDALTAGRGHGELVTLLYRQLLGRDPDVGGRQFYEGLLASGGATPQDLARRILDGAQGNDLDVIANRIEVSAYYTGQIAQSGAPFDIAGNRGILEDVTADDATVAGARAAVDTALNPPPVPGFELAILHINDHHSHLEPNSSADLTLDGVVTRVETGGFARVVAKFAELEGMHDNVLKLHAGDATTGTIYFSSFKGQPDAELMNLVCFDAFTLGNHEFDDSDAGLARFLGFLAADPKTCNSPVLSANVIPAVGTPLRPNATTSLVKPYVVKTVGGERIAIIGLTIADKTRNSSSPLPSTQLLSELSSAQQYIDSMSRLGIDKFVVLSHYGYEADLLLAQGLHGVDVIVGGDSHSLLGDAFADLGLNPEGPYPSEVSDAGGNPVCVAQAWQYSDVVGELLVSFDDAGRVTACGGTPHLLIGDTFARNGVELAGDERQAVLDFVAAAPELSILTPDPVAQSLLARYTAQVDALKTTVVGVASENLCLERIPGQGRSAICPREATQANGGDIQQVVTDAFLARSFEADIAIQNAGGVRIDLPQGNITIETAFTVLPFANTLVNLDLSGAEVRQVLEEALENAIRIGGSSGAYPYGSGIRWHVDLTQPFGSRFSNIEIRRRGTLNWVPLADGDDLTVVTNSFLAGGGDGYVTFRTARDEGRVTDTYIDYAQALIDYLQQDLGGAQPGDPVLAVPPMIGPPPCADYSTQLFTNQAGVTLLPDPLFPRACEGSM